MRWPWTRRPELDALHQQAADGAREATVKAAQTDRLIQALDRRIGQNHLSDAMVEMIKQGRAPA